jgi:hypothetical protein
MVEHTDFEGYKAISNNTINNMPEDLNGLRSAMKPNRFVSPLRERRTLGQYNSQQYLPTTSKK